MKAPFVITVVGPESSGKTTLVRELAAAIGCSWLPEHARTFLAALNRPYQFDDLVQLAHEQQEQIQAVISQWANTQIAHPEVLTHWLDQQAGFDTREFIASLRPYRDFILIVDSGMLTLQQWASIKYQQQIDVVERSLAEDSTNMYLLTRAKKPWEPDPLREAPNFLERVWIYNKYFQALAGGTKPFYVVNEAVIQDSTD